MSRIGVDMQQVNAPLIEFSHVQKSYDGKSLIIRDLNLAIRKGEFLTLLGASGSGKTTTLMMLAGFESPTRGEIRMGGKHIEKVPAHKRGMGMVFQNYALFPHMSVAENLAYPLKMRGLNRVDVQKKVERAMDMVQLHAMAQRRPNELSGGQQQRVALARAMVFEPEVILMDEPLGALDKNLREHMQYEIKQLHKSLGVTVVYVTHDQSEALTMSDRVAVFHQGDIAQLGSPVSLYEHPENAYVANFIGENNILTGTLNSVSGTECSVMLDAGIQVRGSSLGLHGSRPNRVQLVIRPEKVVLTSVVELGRSAKVADIVYLGDHLRVHLHLPKNNAIVVKVPNNAEFNTIRKGQDVGYSWSSSDAHLFEIV